ncbi:X-Pro dipeptidyl-peptidase domain protein [Sulfobacillus acidophilus TPY]|uniref:Hydrolase CocE/NonD family protein n=1 Tax=Sulfobacillus acidophilus (strain ATCC 700253 / DSM 10332 / NAL) TaxID=679936 RepID=G8TUR8_SULAD|nr:X-Pro dipeptidyl-peptidase domain protein [Sulfobacillus acidophilus TPY]AEW05792.1 hydrolase CocE/NonD family protein [Sulfobacillus acidophilus DSM 10332]
MSDLGVSIERGVPCILRDGTRLDADVYRPNIDEPLPVLLMRQPYGRALASTVTYAHPIWYARHGYLVVIQDVRGRGTSEGTFNPFVQEVEDGYDAVEWAAKLPGSSGRVGMYGFSYQGATQWAALAGHPPHLAAIAPAMCAADLYHGWFYRDGRLALTELGWAMQLARDTAQRQQDLKRVEALTEAMLKPPYWRLPLADQPELSGLEVPFWAEWVAHDHYDAYWAERNWLPQALAQPIPTLQVGGWFDPYLVGTLQSYTALRAQDPGRHTLLIGPWGHIPWGQKSVAYTAGPPGDRRPDEIAIKFFDYWLKNKESDGWGAPVQYYCLGQNTWVDTDHWPPPHIPRRWYLHSQGQANGASGDGTLVREPALDQPPDLYVYDARLPMALDSYAPVDRSLLQERREILVYTGPPLERDLVLVGSASLRLFAQVLDGPTDLIAVLSAKAPDGSALFLSMARETLSTPFDEPMSPLMLTFRPIAVRLSAGMQLRLELTSSAFPLLARHPNGDQPVSAATLLTLKMATVSVWHDREHDTSLLLPIVDLPEEVT